MRSWGTLNSSLPTYPRNQVARVIAASVAGAPFDSFSLLCSDRFAHLGFRNSSITVRTIGRRKSPSSPIIALISLVVLLLFFRVMVRYSVGCFLLPTAYHDLFFLRNFQDTIPTDGEVLSAAEALRNSDQSGARVAVTNGAAALVAPRVIKLPSAPRLAIPSLGARDGQLNYQGWSDSWAYLVGYTPITHEWRLMTLLPPGGLAKSLVLVRARF